MRFYYVDPGLINNVGHHANSCRFITKELKARGIQTTILGERRIEPALRDELDARPFFRAFTYGDLIEDDISGWLEAFDNNCAITVEDLFRIPDIGPDDILFLNSARPAQLMAIGEWLRLIDPNARRRRWWSLRQNRAYILT